MKRSRSWVAAAFTLIFAAMFQPSARGQSVGLVLSGGGAKGIAHVGVIQALEENDIPVDYVAGTSMGAIVGGLYSCGYTPDRMMDLFTSQEFSHWSTGKLNENLEFYFDKQSPTPEWARVNLQLKDSTQFAFGLLPTSLISPLPMNIGFLKIFSKYTEQCGRDFNNLFVPFRCVTSDVYHKHKIVLKDGDLGDAIRASMSFPLVFKPIELNGLLVYDGGIYDNFPVDVMHEDFNPDVIIGVSVSVPDGKPEPGNIYSQLSDMIIQNNDYSLPDKLGIKIQVPVQQFGVLDFQQAREIYDIGYRTGLSMVDSIKSRIQARRGMEEVASRRERFNGSTPQILFDSVEVEGGTEGQNRYIAHLFQPEKGKGVTLAEAEAAYYRAISGGKLSDLLPRVATGENGDMILRLKADVRDNWYVGVGGWLTSSTNSMLYLTSGYRTLSFNSLDAAIKGWIGQSYYAGMLDVNFDLPFSHPSAIGIEGVMSREKFYDDEVLFFKESTPAFVSSYENFIRLKYKLSTGRRSKLTVSAGYGYLRNEYFTVGSPGVLSEHKDKSQYRVWSLRGEYERNTLNNELYPSSGMQLRASLSVSSVAERYLPGGDKSNAGAFVAHPQGILDLLWRSYIPVARNVKLGAMANVVATLRKLSENYSAVLVESPEFAPTPSTKGYFNVGFRSQSYAAAGLMPVWSPVTGLQLRGDFYLYAPIRDMKADATGRACYDGWFRKAEFLGELAAVYNFPFASLSVYGNYLTSPSHNWNFGVCFGLYFQAPRFMR